MKSRFFAESTARLQTLKFTKVPPAEVDRLRFYRLKHRNECVLITDKNGCEGCLVALSFCVLRLTHRSD